MSRVTISSGHGRYIAGARGIIDEVTEARKVVNKVAEVIRSNGGIVSIFHDDVTKPGGTNVSNIVRFHNSQQRDLDVSVHFNAVAGGTKESGIGTETLYLTGNSVTGRLASDVSKAISDASGLILRHPGNHFRGAVARNNLGFINGSKKQAILIEVCFVNSQTDVRLYQSNFDAICRAIAGIIANVTISVNSPVTPDPIIPPPIVVDRPGEFPIKESTIDSMMELEVIGSPDYWLKVDSLQWLDELLVNAIESKALNKNNHQGLSSVDDALDLLTVIGIMNSPDYWRAAIESNRVSHLGQLIINLANRVNVRHSLSDA